MSPYVNILFDTIAVRTKKQKKRHKDSLLLKPYSYTGFDTTGQQGDLRPTGQQGDLRPTGQQGDLR